MGIIFSIIIIIISNLQLNFIGQSLSESEKEANNKIILPVYIISVVHIVICSICFLIGYILFCCEYKILAVIITNISDIILGDIVINILIPNGKTIINNLTNDSNQEIIQITQDKLELSQWIIFSIKMILLFSLVISFLLKI